MARMLRQQRSFTIGVIVPEISEGYAALVLSGIEDHLLAGRLFLFRRQPSPSQRFDRGISAPAATTSGGRADPGGHRLPTGTFRARSFLFPDTNKLPGVTNISLESQPRGTSGARSPDESRPSQNRFHQGTGIQLGYRSSLESGASRGAGSWPGSGRKTDGATGERVAHAAAGLRHDLQTTADWASRSARCLRSMIFPRWERFARCAKRAAEFPKMFR